MVANLVYWRRDISFIMWWSVLLVEETGVPGENHQPVASHWQTLSHNVVSTTPHLNWIRIHTVSGDSVFYELHTTRGKDESNIVFMRKS
jgi:hypothetical protein